jgi:hypothetical protein
VRPWFGDPLPVTMAQTGPTTYEGTLDIADALEGGVDVSAVGTGGQSDTTTVFRIQQLLADQPATLYSPEGRLDANLPYGTLTSDALAVSIGSGDAPITPSPSGLLFLAEPMSFHLEDDATVGSMYTLNWHLDPESLVGRDGSTLVLQRFDEPTGQWVPVAASFTAGFPVISASDAAEGIYAVLATESTDATPPGAIADLAAVTGTGGWSVVLSWTAPGDDGSDGQTVRYHVLFDTQPITEQAVESCMELPMRDAPLPAGQAEQHAFEMPDPDVYYYFAVQAEDEAGNRGLLSNVATARSYVQDTDGDGLPDQWELAFGLDPNAPGDEMLDPDGDGLINLLEYRYGTLPTVWDTDGDGFSDGTQFPDFNDDGVLDLGDVEIAINCLTGPDIVAEPSCGSPDLDGDQDVDLRDFAAFQRGFAGP